MLAIGMPGIPELLIIFALFLVAFILIKLFMQMMG